MRYLWLLALPLLAACTQPQALQQGAVVQEGLLNRSIIMMPMDVQASLLTAGGLNEPNAEWTQQAEQALSSALVNYATTNTIQLVDYEEPPVSLPNQLALHSEIRALHGAVGNSILIHKFGALPLPTKTEVFDWSLGPEVANLDSRYGADYALFLFARDSFSSGGRVALQMAAAILGVGVTGGQQVAFASLVDLETGDIAWFNFSLRGTGDMRTQDGADALVKRLLATLPVTAKPPNP